MLHGEALREFYELVNHNNVTANGHLNKIKQILLVSILPYTSIEVFLLNWGGIWPPLYLWKYSKMRAFYGKIRNHHAFKPHGENHTTLWFSKSSFFLPWKNIEAPKSTPQKRAKKRQKEACDGADQSTQYHRNQDQDQGRACHFTSQFLEALRSEQENHNSRWQCPWGVDWAERDCIG